MAAHHPSVRPCILVVMGCTGVGKSTFIRTVGAVSLDPVDKHHLPIIGDGFEPCTSAPNLYEVPDTNLVLVDTPGFNDTTSSNRVVLRKISNTLSGLHLNGTDIGGVLYLHSINDDCVSGGAKRNLDIFGKMLGLDNMRHCMFVTTKWSCEVQAKAQSREIELVNNSSFWKPMLDAGAGYTRFIDTRDSVMEAISTLRNGEVLVPQVIKEWIHEEKHLHETQAGRTVEVYVEQEQLFREEATGTPRTKGFETARLVEKGPRDLEYELQMMEAERDKLRIEYETQRRKQEAEHEMQRKQQEAEYEMQRKQQEAEWESQRKADEERNRLAMESQRRLQNEATEEWEARMQRLEQEHEAAKTAFQRKLVLQSQRAAESSKERWARRGILGILGAGAIVLTAGIATPIVAGLAIAHEIECQEEKEKE